MIFKVCIYALVIEKITFKNNCQKLHFLTYYLEFFTQSYAYYNIIGIM